MFSAVSFDVAQDGVCGKEIFRLRKTMLAGPERKSPKWESQDWNSAGFCYIMLIVFIDILRVIRNGLHHSRTKVSQASYPRLADKYGWRNGIWNVMRININSVGHQNNDGWQISYINRWSCRNVVDIDFQWTRPYTSVTSWIQFSRPTKKILEMPRILAYKGL